MTASSFSPLLGITMGDPLGIGPEIIIKAFEQINTDTVCRPVIIGDEQILEQAIKLVGSSHHIHLINDPDQGIFKRGTINLIESSPLGKIEFNATPTRETGLAMQSYIIKAIDLCLEHKIAGMVTCPITKTALTLSGSQFHGHTEMLANHTSTDKFAMMLAGKTLRVVLATIHIPLSRVAEQLTTETIVQTIELTHKGLKERFHLNNPKIAVAGLNPHSGEDSLFGHEEQKIILPAVQACAKNGININGPLPPDTVFYHAVNGRFDAVVCMYHDQGLIPFKLVHFKDGVNTTLGLPIIRTSVDHGTAYDIAWKGIADPASLIAAVKMAAFQSNHLSSQTKEINGN
jgi:4-hydroxythreonine-4-phosphate dehydrogenase